MELARITSRRQTTIPKRNRERANLHAGDVIAFEIDGTHVVLRKVSGRGTYLQGLSEGMTEWASPEDEEAWRDL
ncbi:MAG: AbrB/MazE/SpoVT family DNA-binding domain-containing protein [Gammaproteobacteria bacterium]|nr:AbrB/MazE/SpoVT family DNA-binding domain-containing protein [Gammaproteobacteria bacterium]MYE83439.1 AbrB/MazE/SpoVT family DNA-binding domain-containing protein [Gammaproteobacteria bacterium]